MEMLGEARLAAPREQVWLALNDPRVLQASIPGCESLQGSGDDAFHASVVSSIGPVKARFAGKLILSKVQAPRSYTLRAEGSGGAAGFAKADIEVSLEALEPSLTLLRYKVQATVGGKLAQLGSRMVDAAARKSAEDFFARFGAEVAALAAAGPQPAPAPLDLQALAGPAVAAIAQAGGQERGQERGQAAPPPAAGARAAAGLLAASAEEVAGVLASECIQVWIADHIALVTLNRPRSRNAMTLAMWRSMPAIMAALERNPEVRAVLLCGAGGDFCAGADISEFAQVRDDPAQARAYELAVDACCDAIAGLAKPTLAVLRGYCLGGGAHLAMSCDLRFAAADAVFGIPAARLSIIYGVHGTRRLLALVGLAQAKKILFGARRFDAEEALRIGFVDQVAGAGARQRGRWWSRWRGRAAPGADAMAQARDFARTLADNAPLSIAGAKALLNGMAMGLGALDAGRAEALIAAASASEDYREGRAAFAQKRAARFQGR